MATTGRFFFPAYSDLSRQPFILKDHHDRKAMTPFCYFLYFYTKIIKIISFFLDNPDVIVGEVLLSPDLLIKSLLAFTCEINDLFVVWMGCWDLSVKARWEKLMQLCAGISTNPQGSTQTPSRAVRLCVCEHTWNVRALVMLSQCAVSIACYGVFCFTPEVGFSKFRDDNAIRNTTLKSQFQQTTPSSQFNIAAWKLCIILFIS